MNNVLQSTSYADMSYDRVIKPLVTEMEEYMRTHDIKLMPKRTFNLPVDIYTELITQKVVSNYANGIVSDKLPNECIILMLIRYPYFINIVQCNHTFKEYLRYRESLLETFDNMFPVKSNEMVRHVRELLTTKIEDAYDLRTSSMVHYLHYLTGFRFERGMVAVTADALPKGPDVSYLVVNLTYNISNLNSIIIYHDSPKIKDKLLNVANIPNYKCIERPENVCRADTPFISTDDTFKAIEYYKPNVYILLCYNDNEDIHRCHFTIAYYGENGFVSPEFVNNMLEGSLPTSITMTDVNNYINTVFMKTFSDDPESVDLLHKEIQTMIDIVCKAYDDAKLANLTKAPMYDHIIRSILADKRLPPIVHSDEIPFFKIYLTNMIVVHANDYDSPNIKDMLCRYVCAYIHEDAYDNLLFHS